MDDGCQVPHGTWQLSSRWVRQRSLLMACCAEWRVEVRETARQNGGRPPAETSSTVVIYCAAVASVERRGSVSNLS
jgi:hypothetical protein